MTVGRVNFVVGPVTRVVVRDVGEEPITSRVIGGILGMREFFKGAFLYDGTLSPAEAISRLEKRQGLVEFGLRGMEICTAIGLQVFRREEIGYLGEDLFMGRWTQNPVVKVFTHTEPLTIDGFWRFTCLFPRAIEGIVPEHSRVLGLARAGAKNGGQSFITHLTQQEKFSLAGWFGFPNRFYSVRMWVENSVFSVRYYPGWRDRLPRLPETARPSLLGVGFGDPNSFDCVIRYQPKP